MIGTRTGLLASSVEKKNYLLNGSFDANVIPTNSWVNQVPTNWSSTSTYTIIANNTLTWTALPAKHGKNICGLHMGKSFIQQTTLPLSIGSTYKLMFWVTWRTGYVQPSLIVYQDTNVIFPTTTIPSGTEWTNYSCQFTATNTTHVIKFVNDLVLNVEGTVLLDIITLKLLN